MSTAPNLRVERAMLRSGIEVLACIDEAGRGAVCGPVSLAVVLVTARTGPAPRGVRDSKLLSPSQRERLVPRIMRWAPHAVGMASAAEIDRLGIITAMRLAGHRALAALPCIPGRILLDGNHDYLTPPLQQGLFEAEPTDVLVPPVVTMVKADVRCSGVAAASVLAKTARDAVMMDLGRTYPQYRLEQNKGYAAAEHLSALAQWGPTPHHRVSWKLPGSADAGCTDVVGPSTVGSDTRCCRDPLRG